MSLLYRRCQVLPECMSGAALAILSCSAGTTNDYLWATTGPLYVIGVSNGVVCFLIAAGHSSVYREEGYASGSHALLVIETVQTSYQSFIKHKHGHSSCMRQCPWKSSQAEEAALTAAQFTVLIKPRLHPRQPSSRFPS